MVGPRRRAREIALQILIQMDVSPEMDSARAVRLYFEHLADDAGDDVEPESGELRARRYAGTGAFDRELVEELVRGTGAHRAELDAVVQSLSHNWRLERMALVERNVIRLALYELKFAGNVPVNVALDEAIELAKRYGTAEGAAFVNGLLDRAVTELQIRR